MGKNLVKILALVVALLMFTSFIAGCGNNSGSTEKSTTAVQTEKSATSNVTEKPKDFVTMKVLYPGDESKRMESFLKDEFATKIKDELNLGIEVNYSPWDQYWNKKDMMLASGEDLDWYWDATVYLSKNVSQKKFYPLNDVFDKYGADIKKLVPEQVFKALTFDGNLVAIPTAYAPTAELFHSVLVRQDLLEAVGMKELKTLSDVNQFFEKAKVKFPEDKAVASYGHNELVRSVGEPYALFGMFESAAIDMANNKVSSYYESDSFKKTSKIMSDWKKLGYVPDDVTMKYDEHAGRFASGNYLIEQGAISLPLEQIGAVQKNAPQAKLKEYILEPEKPKYAFYANFNHIIIGPNCKIPDRVMMFLDWIFKSKDNYNFTLYGVKDKDYTLVNNRIKLINTDVLFYEWMFRNVNLMDFPDSVDDDFINSFKNWDKDTTPSKSFGFVFDSNAVKSEEAQIATVITEKFRPIETGFTDYDKSYPDAQKALKAAGIDKYIAEMQRQLDVYVAGQK